VATPDAGPDRARVPELEVGAGREPDDRDGGLAHGEIAWRGAAAPAPWTAAAPRGDDGWPEEVGVCELCGLVSRRPVPAVCPACGGGYG